MKSLFLFFISISMLMFCISCEDLFKKDDPTVLKGDPSPMGEVGVTVSSSLAPIAGVSNFSATVTALKDGVSTYSGSATVTNSLIKNMVSNFPGVTINGNTVSIANMQIQQTTDGIKCMTGTGNGILVKYDSNVGDTYQVGSTDKVRTVVAKTGVDDYPYGFYQIKVIQVDESTSYLKSTSGITKITYVANHKFGLVGVKVAFDDGTSSTFPVYSSTQN
jgi:hypothetical protein